MDQSDHNKGKRRASDASFNTDSGQHTEQNGPRKIGESHDQTAPRRLHTPQQDLDFQEYRRPAVSSRPDSARPPRDGAPQEQTRAIPKPESTRYQHANPRYGQRMDRAGDPFPVYDEREHLTPIDQNYDPYEEYDAIQDDAPLYTPSGASKVSPIQSGFAKLAGMFSRSKKAPQSATPGEDETVVFDDGFSMDLSQKEALHNTQELPAFFRKRRTFRTLFKPRDTKPNFFVGVFLTTAKVLFAVIFIVISMGVGTVFGVANTYLDTTPELDTGKLAEQTLSSNIYDLDGNLLATYYGSENREWAPLESIPVDLQNAIIAVEDIRFKDHDGVDYRRLLGAFVSNLSSSSVEGGSTITQQLVKNKLLTNERSYKRKLQEAYLATQLEKKYSKDEILEAYLNSIPLGGIVYGVKAAAKDYFGKELSQLTLREMACLAAITQNPSKLNPRSATYNGKEDQYLFGKKGLIDRINIILERMYWAGMISEAQFNEARIPYEVYSQPGYLDTWKAEMNILEKSPAIELYQYPHFVEYVVHQVQTFMLRDQNLDDTKENRQKVDKEMRAGGYKIYATINPEIQKAVQSTLSEYEDYPSFGKEANNVKILKDNAGNEIEVAQPQAAAVVMENETGYLRAIVGSRDEPTQRLTYNRAYQGQMPVGSSIKPIAVYGPAMDNGYGAGGPVANIEVPIEGWDTEKGHPLTSKGTPGPASFRTAIVKSWNISAGRTLMELISPSISVEYLRNLGVSEENINSTPVGLAMGQSTVSPVEMAGAYSAFSRYGEYWEPISFTKVVDSAGSTIIDAEAERIKRNVFKPSTAWLLTDILTEATSSEGTGHRARLEGMTTAGKTGTVVDNKGVFFSGLTPYYTSALWIGHDDYISMPGSSSATKVSAPLWKKYMQKIHEGKTDKPFYAETPDQMGLTQVAICQYSGKLPSASCAAQFTDYIAVEDVPTETCTWCTGGEGTAICAASEMLFHEGYCPPDQYAIRQQTSFPDTSPYYWQATGQDPRSTDVRTGQVSSQAPTEYCNIHLWAYAVDPVPPPDPNAPVTPEVPNTPTQTQPPEIEGPAVEDLAAAQ